MLVAVSLKPIVEEIVFRNLLAQPEIITATLISENFNS
jgi:hypothetical protein